MPTRYDPDSEDFSSWEDDYPAPASDTSEDSTDDSDLESTRTEDLSESEGSIQSPSGSDSDVDIEEIRAELLHLRFPFQDDRITRARTKTREHRPKPIPQAQNERSRNVVDLRSLSPANAIEIHSDSDSGRSRSRFQVQKSKLPVSLGAERAARTKQRQRQRVVFSSDKESELGDAQPLMVKAPQSHKDSHTYLRPGPGAQKRAGQAVVIDISSDNSSEGDTEADKAVAQKEVFSTPHFSSEQDIWVVPESPMVTEKTRQNRLGSINGNRAGQKKHHRPRYPPPSTLSKPSHARDIDSEEFDLASTTTHDSPHLATFIPNNQFKNLNHYSINNEELKAGMDMERKGRAANGERSMFKVFRLLKHKDNKVVYVEGRRFVVTSTLPQIEGSRLGLANEVTAVIVENQDDGTSTYCLERFPVQEVLCTRKVNLLSPSISNFAYQIPIYAPESFFCKSVMFLRYRNREEWQSSLTKISGALRPLKPDEVDNVAAMGSGILRMKPATPYAFIDICCSIGGASEAAELAGLKVVDGVEIDPLRGMCYKANFPTARIHIEDIFKPSSKFKLASLIAAILHISMPCKYWSAAHTTAGKDDEKNRALLHEIPNLIKRIRPRQVTIEQVPGLVSITKHQGDFNKFVFAILALGYSVAWKLISFEKHGGNAKRQRLILLASAPGEALPPWPEASHGPGLQPFVTAKKALRGLELPDASEIDMKNPGGRTVLCDSNKLLALTVVRKRHPIQKRDGEEYKVLHWSGRPFLYQELARFQNLRQDRLWTGKPAECAEMIGDAVPPLPYSAVLKAVAKTLHETDDGNGPVSRSHYDEPYAFMPSQGPRPSAHGPEKSNLQENTSGSTESRPANVSRKRTAPTTPGDDSPVKKRSTGPSSWIASRVSSTWSKQ
ncbi:hypothetical protein EG328_009689 [Venturia inaequalis]|uniref:DNA (cytosine-5-)-methyltransferase n=1 Tax=Venturia inaequalis TaxID=5025 RepID=A0A8H3ZDS1_VENIN|nr:hypothetical protein EG328_009689 [Venturia inaequalis]